MTRVRLPHHDQDAIEAAENLMGLIRMVETRTDNLLKHLNAGGYAETAERLHAASDRVSNGRNLSKKRNNTSGATGVRRLPSGRYWAYLKVDGRQIGLGSHATMDAAASARRVAQRQYGFSGGHGE